MSLHSSLRVDPTRTKHRNVLKRHERIQKLIEQEKWNDRPSAFGLPKVKSVKVKVKKVKEVAEGAAAAPGAAKPAAGAPAAGTKPAAKPAAAKAAAPAAEKKAPAPKK